MMESINELNIEILKITMTIQEKYPELTKYLNEMPLGIPIAKSSAINRKNLTDYYDSLVSLLENYSHVLTPENLK